MKKILCVLFACVLSFQVTSQELNAQVIVNSDLVNQTNQQIFKTLERTLKEFINTQVWTEQVFLNQEKITCSFVFNLSAYSNDQFEATLQVQSERPVYQTNYDSPVLNFLDKDITFSYQEFQPLFFNESSFESNLISLISFYAYVIIGLDADTFLQNGGNRYFEKARQVVNLAQSSVRKGWKPGDGLRNRFWLIDSLRSNTFKEYRQTMYNYHRSGLDQMTNDPIAGKKALMLINSRLRTIISEKTKCIFITIIF